jgi:hypothetical protein
MNDLLLILARLLTTLAKLPGPGGAKAINHEFPDVPQL